MAVVHAASARESWLSRLMTTDFCPWANRFVYWLKEPIGWFALATAISVMIGLHFSPIGWTIAASLAAIMVTGMAWPWIAVRVTRCRLHSETDAVHEDTPCRMVLSVRNHIPLPVWGLAVEGFLDCDLCVEEKPTVGLAYVPPLCTADYCVDLTPALRGHYPVTKPQVTCSFPFGIWTARRGLSDVKPLTVWPKLYPVLGVIPIAGQANADQGNGRRGGRSGEFVGVRTFRRGDSAKHVNWAASARSDSMIVTERGESQSVELEVLVDTNRYDANSQVNCKSLALRVRVAASVLSSLHQSRIATRVRLGDRTLATRFDARGRRQMLDALASIPINGETCEQPRLASARARILITGSSDGEVLVQINNPLGGQRAGGAIREISLAHNDQLPAAMASLWKEVRDVDVAA